MRRKTARLLLSGGILAAVLSGGALALSGGDSLISLRELNEIFLPKAQTQMEERMNSALQSTYDQALAQSQGESGGGSLLPEGISTPSVTSMNAPLWITSPVPAMASTPEPAGRVRVSPWWKVRLRRSALYRPPPPPLSP